MCFHHNHAHAARIKDLEDTVTRLGRLLGEARDRVEQQEGQINAYRRAAMNSDKDDAK
jgi:hypothetical protein